MGSRIKDKQSPKYCRKCGKQGRCVDSRHYADRIYRRYRDTSNHKWSTYEYLMEQDEKDYKNSMKKKSGFPKGTRKRNNDNAS